MIWKQETSLDLLNTVLKNTLADHLGIEFTEIGTDFLVATMPVDHRTKQPIGLLHGGASVALAETIGSVAGWLCVDDWDDSSVVGIEGIVTATVKPIRIGKRIQVWQVNLTHQDELICTSRLTTMTVPLNNK